MTDEFYLDQNKVIELGGYLVYSMNYTAKELQYYYEKPHKFVNHWKDFEELKQ